VARIPYKQCRGASLVYRSCFGSRAPCYLQVIAYALFLERLPLYVVVLVLVRKTWP
jgi:hypothetical protein